MLGTSSFFATLCKSVTISESAPSIDLGVTDTFQRAGELANTEYANDKTVHSPSITEQDPMGPSRHTPLPHILALIPL